MQCSLHLLPPELWPQVPELARMRIENKVLNSIKEGHLDKGVVPSKTLAVWANDHFPCFSTREAIRQEFIRKLGSNNESEMRYVVSNFFLTIPTFVASGPDRVNNSQAMDCFVVALEFFVRERDQQVYAELVQNFDALPATWQDALADALVDMTDEGNPLLITATGHAFLTEPAPPNLLFKYRVAISPDDL